MLNNYLSDQFNEDSQTKCDANVAARTISCADLCYTCYGKYLKLRSIWLYVSYLRSNQTVTKLTVHCYLIRDVNPQTIFCIKNVFVRNKATLWNRQVNVVYSLKPRRETDNMFIHWTHLFENMQINPRMHRYTDRKGNCWASLPKPVNL